MPEIKLIGITGKARSGKDTAATFIQRRIGGTRYSLAQPIYDMLAAVGFDFQSHVWLGMKEMEIPGLGKSPRQMLQTLGTEWGRQCIHPDLWIRLAELKLDYATRMIVSDVRFDNEADWIRRNGILFRIVRPDAEMVAPHISEAGVTPRDGDILIENNSTLENLEKLVNLMVDHVFET